MSYEYYLKYFQQLMASGMYSVPVQYTTMSTILPIHHVQPIIPMDRNDTLSCESDEDDVDERTLFCANLCENVTEELLYEVFLQAGPIGKVYIPKDNNGKRRSYGFVTYSYRSSLPYAMRLYQGLVLFGKLLDIKFQGKCNKNVYNYT